VQPATPKFFPGLEQVKEVLEPTRTPLSICCVVKNYGIKVNTSFDKNTILETEVKGLIQDLGRWLDKILRSLQADRGDGLMKNMMDAKLFAS